jgi:hypothetical protein
MEFRRFLNVFIRIPVQIVRQGRRVIYPVLAWNRSLAVFFSRLGRHPRPLLSAHHSKPETGVSCVTLNPALGEP